MIRFIENGGSCIFRVMTSHMHMRLQSHRVSRYSFLCQVNVLMDLHKANRETPLTPRIIYIPSPYATVRIVSFGH